MKRILDIGSDIYHDNIKLGVEITQIQNVYVHITFTDAEQGRFVDTRILLNTEELQRLTQAFLEACLEAE